MTRTRKRHWKCAGCGAGVWLPAACPPPVCPCGLDPTKPHLHGRLTPKQMTPVEEPA